MTALLLRTSFQKFKSGSVPWLFQLCGYLEIWVVSKRLTHLLEYYATIGISSQTKQNSLTNILCCSSRNSIVPLKTMVCTSLRSEISRRIGGKSPNCKCSLKYITYSYCILQEEVIHSNICICLLLHNFLSDEWDTYIQPKSPNNRIIEIIKGHYQIDIP